MSIDLAILNVSRGQLSRGYCQYLSCILPELTNDTRISRILVILPSKIDLKFLHYKVNIKYLDRLSSSRSQVRSALNSFKPNIIFIPTCLVFRYQSVPVVNMIQNWSLFRLLSWQILLHRSLKIYCVLSYLYFLAGFLIQRLQYRFT